MGTLRLLVVGSANYDLILRSDRLPREGEAVVGAVLEESCGGKGANQAVAAARFLRAHARHDDVSVIFVGAVGADVFGAREIADLAAAGVDVELVRRVADQPTGLSTIWVDRRSGQNRILNAPGANLAVTCEQVAAAPVESADLVLLQNEIPRAPLAAVAGRAAAAGVPILWDPAPFPPQAQLPIPAASCWYVTPNEPEAESLLGRPLRRDRLLDDARALRRAGFPGVVLTLGPGGAAVASRDGEDWLEPAPRVEAVDSTGAGDAFCGALAASWLLHRDFRRAVADGVRYASQSVTAAGAQSSFPSQLAGETA